MAAESNPLIFERMVCSFENVGFKYAGNEALPDAVTFLDAMHSVSLLFDHLGTGFHFVRRDIIDKTALLREYHAEDTKLAGSLQDLVEREISKNTHRIGKPSKFARVKHRPSASRTLWRLLWAVKFLHILLREIGRELGKPASRAGEAAVAGTAAESGSGTIRPAVDRAYKEALYEHHSYPLRRAVQAALAFLPTTDSFLRAVGVHEANREELMQRCEAALRPVMTKGYNFYTSREMTDLP